MRYMIKHVLSTAPAHPTFCVSPHLYRLRCDSFPTLASLKTFPGLCSENQHEEPFLCTVSLCWSISPPQSLAWFSLLAPVHFYCLESPRTQVGNMVMFPVWFPVWVIPLTCVNNQSPWTQASLLVQRSQPCSFRQSRPSLLNSMSNW